MEARQEEGKGSHYRVRVGAKVTTIQKDLNPGRIERILKQLGVSPADL
jgi:predicted RNA binding protein YcfA (HicA-like mRNA interferase family)